MNDGDERDDERKTTRERRDRKMTERESAYVCGLHAFGALGYASGLQTNPCYST